MCFVTFCGGNQWLQLLLWNVGLTSRCCGARSLVAALQAAGSFQKSVENLRSNQTFFQVKFALQTPVALSSRAVVGVWSCSEVGPEESGSVESAEEGAVLLLIIPIASRGKCCFFICFTNCLQRQDSVPAPALSSSCRRCLK